MHDSQTTSPAPDTFDRRSFMRRGAMGAGAMWMFSLSEFAARKGFAAPLASPYGPIGPVKDLSTGLELLQLPAGFRYWSYGWTGDPMRDGIPTPALHDGMAVVDARGNSGQLILVRNHEGAAGTPYLDDAGITYRNDGAGGTTNLVFNTRKERWQDSWATLAGTNRNCAGGVTPWGTWITSEETGDAGHGWQFEVGRNHGDPRPLVDMGRFSHEACMVDPETGAIYQTEDSNDCGFYKFVPNVPGELLEGGELFMLKVKGVDNADLQRVTTHGQTWDVEWVRIADPTAAAQSTYQQGAALKGAKFRRLEGAWWGDRTGYFLATDGGRITGGTSGEGQVFEYDPRAETVTLIYNSPDPRECENPDNLTVTPRGGLLLCEDNSSPGPTPPNGGERLLGLTLDGRAFTFCQNNIVLTGSYNSAVGAGDYRQNEFAGACYSPDGQWLFANIQTPGITFAITGPWGRTGPL